MDQRWDERKSYRKGLYVGWEKNSPLFITRSPKKAGLWVLRGWTVVQAINTKKEWNQRTLKWSDCWERING